MQFQLTLSAEYGASLSQTDSSGRSSIETACWYGHARVLQTLLQFQTPLPSSTSSPSISTLSSAGTSASSSSPPQTLSSSPKSNPLHIAAFRGHFHCINTLLEFGYDVDEVDSDGKRPIHCAAVSGQRECLQFLLSKGADPFSEIRDSGVTAASIGLHAHLSDFFLF